MFLRRVNAFTRLNPIGIVLKIAFAFAVVIWLSSFGGGRAKGAVLDFKAFATLACAAQ